MGDIQRSFRREFKLEGVRLVTEGCLSLYRAARDLGISERVLRRMRRQLAQDPAEAFLGKGHLKSQDEGLRRLRREN
jgi:transposase